MKGSTSCCDGVNAWRLLGPTEPESRPCSSCWLVRLHAMKAMLFWVIGISLSLLVLASGLVLSRRGKGGSGFSPQGMMAPGQINPNQTPPPMHAPAPDAAMFAPPPAPLAAASQFPAAQMLPPTSQMTPFAPSPVSESTSSPLSTSDALAALLPNALVSSEPPVPAEGLPAGWTMEQWRWYGEEWLRNNNRS